MKNAVPYLLVLNLRLAQKSALLTKRLLTHWPVNEHNNKVLNVKDKHEISSNVV